MLKRCVCYIIVILFRGIRVFSTYCLPGARSKHRPWAMVPPPLPLLRSLKWQAWKPHAERDIEKCGLYFQFDSHNLNSANYIDTKPRLLDLCAGKSWSPKLSETSLYIASWKFWYMAQYYAVISKIDLLWASLEKTIVMYLIINSNVFYILFATNKSISECVFSRIKGTCIIVVLTSKSAF